MDPVSYLDREREEVDLLQTLDFAVFDETTEFGYGNPFLLIFATAASSAATASTTASATTATTASTATSSTKTSSKSTTIGWSRIRHAAISMSKHFLLGLFSGESLLADHKMTGSKVALMSKLSFGYLKST